MQAASATLIEAAPPARRPVNKWLITVSISFGTLMGAIDTSIVNVALPHIQGSVGATVQEITWISTGYAVALVLLMPLTAFLGRIFGQKRVYMICLALFIVGSALCGTATSLAQLVVYRAVQGLGAGALQPTEQAILRQTFPLEEQGMAMAVFAMVVMIGPAVGPTLGGYIVDHAHWSWIFFINLPIGVLGFFMVLSFLHEDPQILAANRAQAQLERKHVDWAGIALMSISLSSFEYFLEEGERDDWFQSKLIVACCFVAVVTMATFIIRELTATAPVVNLRLFKERVFLSGTLIGALMFAMLMANMFLLPIFMQELLGFTATQSGIALVPRTLVMMVAVPIVGRVYNYLSPRLTIAFGIVAFCYGAYEMSLLTLESGAMDVIWTMAIQGVGFACLFVPLTTVALSKVPRHQLADATGLNSVLRQFGGAVGLAIFATLLDRYAVQARAAIGSHVTAVDPRVQARLAASAHALVAHGMPMDTARSASIGALANSVRVQAQVVAFDRIFLLAGILFLFVMPLLIFLKGDAPLARKGELHLE